MFRLKKTKFKKELSPLAIEALSALHSTKKPMQEMMEWTALDCFRLRKAEDLPGGGLSIIVKEFQIKEIK